MASETTRSTWGALVLPNTRVTLDTTLSSFTSAEPRPGVPEPAQDTGMVLQTSGSQSAGGALEVQTLRGGYPGAQSAAEGASYVWREDGDADTEWRGWDVPSVMTAHEVILFVDGTGTDVTNLLHPHLISLADGTLLLAYEVTDLNGVDPTTYEIRTRTRAPGATSWSSPVSAVTWTGLPAPRFHACLVLLGSGRIMLYHWVNDTVKDVCQIRALYSDDDGGTWAVAQDYCLADGVDSTNLGGGFGSGITGYEFQRIRGAAKDGQVLLTVHIQRHDNDNDVDAIRQYASSDGGLTFSQVWESAVGQSFGYPDVVAAGGRFIMAYVDGDLLAIAYTQWIGSAFTAFSDSSGAAGVIAGSFYADDANPMTNGNLALVADETETLYLFGYDPGTHYTGTVFRSLDYASTWDSIGNSSLGTGAAVWWFTNDSETFPNYITAASSEGRIVMAHSHVANHNTSDPTLWVGYFGGYSQVTMPGYQRFPEETERVSWEWNYLPYETPNQVGWTPTGAGTPSLTAGYFQVSTAANTLYYTRNPTGAIGEPIIVRFDMTITSGGDITDDDVAVRIVQDNGAANFDVTIYLAISTTVRYQVYDNNAAGDVGTAQDTGGVIGSVLVCMDNGSVKVWHRASGGSGAKLADREWALGASSTGLTDGGVVGGGNVVEWGHLSASTAVSRWREVHYTSDEWSGEGLIDQVNPDDLYARPYSATGTYVDDGVIVKALDGPTIRADRWAIDVRHEYGIDRVWDYHPRRRWRSTSTGEQTIIVDLADVAADSWVGEALFIGFYGTTLSQATISGYTGSAWQAIGTAEAHESLDGLRWDRLGDSIRPEDGAASTESPYLQRAEMTGGYFQLAAATNRTIVSQREGKWTDDTQVRPWLVLEDVVDGADASTGTAGRIVPPTWGVVFHTRGVRYEKLRIVQPASAAGVPGGPDGYWDLGVLFVGAVVPFSEEPSWGTVIETQASTEVSQSRDWHTGTYEPAPARRIVDLHWSDPWDHTNSSGYDADPDYFDMESNASAEPAANVRSPGSQLTGVIREVGGPGTPVVLLRGVPRAGDQLQVINRREMHLLMRLGERVRLEQVLGDPGDTDVWRIATLSGEEVV